MIKMTEVHIIVGMYQGIIDDVKAFDTPELANMYEHELCKRYDVPYDSKARENYRMSGISNSDVLHYIVELNKEVD